MEEVTSNNKKKKVFKEDVKVVNVISTCNGCGSPLPKIMDNGLCPKCGVRN